MKEREKERNKLVTEAAEKSREESDEVYKWIVDFEVILVTKEYRAQQPFRPRKYRYSTPNLQIYVYKPGWPGQQN